MKISQLLPFAIALLSAVDAAPVEQRDTTSVDLANNEAGWGRRITAVDLTNNQAGWEKRETADNPINGHPAWGK
jgi:hypothetical protein